MCLPVKIFFRVSSDYGYKYGCKSYYARLYYSRLCMVVFDIVHGLNMLNIAPLRTAAAEALISSSPVVQEGSPEY